MKSTRSLFLKLILILSIAHPFEVFSQGCSDAGFCSIGGLSAQKKDSSYRKHNFTFSIPIGEGDESVLVVTPSLQYDLTLSEAWTTQLKVTGNYAEGTLGKASGAGDVYLSGIYAFTTRSKVRLSFTLGSKFPLNSANLTSEGRPLPMQYQSSLGTTDVIAGITAVMNAWRFSAGWQQPLSGANNNKFLPASWNVPEAQRYPSSNQLARTSDILMRVSYSFLDRKKLYVSGGLLGIYHPVKDTYVDLSSTRSPINGSEGLTLNLTTAFAWWVKENLKFGFNAGVPVAVRAVRPDGLTRSFVFAPEIRWSF